MAKMKMKWQERSELKKVLRVLENTGNFADGGCTIKDVSDRNTRDFLLTMGWIPSISINIVYSALLLTIQSG